MELEFWGVRGTTPVSGKGKNKYGGHTPSATLIASSERQLLLMRELELRNSGIN